MINNQNIQIGQTFTKEFRLEKITYTVTKFTNKSVSLKYDIKCDCGIFGCRTEKKGIVGYPQLNEMFGAK